MTPSGPQKPEGVAFSGRHPMSKLPISPLATAIAVVAGQEVHIRSLTRTQASTWAQMESAAGEAYLLACSMDVTEDEATAWLSSVDFPTVKGLLTAILELSGLASGDEADPTPGSAEPS
jgi:hypothetical protein